MGLSIHYSGQIKHIELVNELMTETVDICKTLEWNCLVLPEKNKDGLTGIYFAPKDCEPIFLTFLPNGRMCSPVNLMYKDMYAANGPDAELLYTTSTKTQYAGPDAHIAIIKLFRYLKEKYFSVFEMSDEGSYWETMDKKVLLEQFAKYEFLLDAVSSALNEMKIIPGETAASLADRIEQMLKKKFK